MRLAQNVLTIKHIFGWFKQGQVTNHQQSFSSVLNVGTQKEITDNFFLYMFQQLLSNRKAFLQFCQRKFFYRLEI